MNGDFDAKVLAFGTREIVAVLGGDFPGRGFLVGGAFKSILTGRPPRDLDLWAPSTDDRRLLVERLESRAEASRPYPYGDAFHVAGRTVEVPDRVEPATLEGRLARSDLGLSAVGVEWAAGAVRAIVSPLARHSVECRQVLLFRPLVNWRHAISTLTRARRYAKELNFELPAEEEAAVWEVFDAQPLEMQREMLDRYRLAAVQGWGVLEEAVARMKQWT